MRLLYSNHKFQGWAVRASKAFSAGLNTIRNTVLCFNIFSPWICVKLFPKVFSLQSIAFLLVALLPLMYVYVRACIQSYFSHHVLPGSKKSALTPSSKCQWNCCLTNQISSWQHRGHLAGVPWCQHFHDLWLDGQKTRLLNAQSRQT